MKLSFSIQNWNRLGWDEFCAVAEGTRMQGIELYDIKSPVFQGKSSPANPDRAAGVRRNLISLGLEIPCISTVLGLTEPGFLWEFDECLETAMNLGIPCVSVHAAADDDEENARVLSGLLERTRERP